jgi:hypothetical protein
MRMGMRIKEIFRKYGPFCVSNTSESNRRTALEPMSMAAKRLLVNMRAKPFRLECRQIHVAKKKSTSGQVRATEKYDPPPGTERCGKLSRGSRRVGDG